jgi:hypothetical protein
MEGSAFPVSTEQDDEQVATALDTATALWSRGDAREALRWLRRAAEMAGEAGDDWRAVQLARAAADLANELQIPPTLVPASVAPIAPRSQPSHPVPAPRSQPSHAPPPLPQPHVAPASMSRPQPAAPSSAPASQPSHQPPRLSRPSYAQSAPSAAGSVAHPPPSVPLRAPPPRRNVEAAEVVTSAPPIGSSEPVSRAATSAASPRPRQALHVAVLPSDEDRSALHVRLLAEGEAIPPGYHEALLVAIEPHTNLLVRRR